MRLALQRTIAILVALACSVHVVMTALFLAPPSLLEERAHGAVTRYMLPLFAQNWHLFSPNPGFASTDLWVRCAPADGGTAEGEGWFDPLHDLRQAHYERRISGRGKLLYVYDGIAKSLSTAYEGALAACARREGKDAEARCTNEAIAPQVTGTPAFSVARRFALDLCRAHDGRPSRAQFKVMTFYPKKFSERHGDGLWGRVEERVFPAVAPPAREVAANL